MKRVRAVLGVRRERDDATGTVRGSSLGKERMEVLIRREGAHEVVAGVTEVELDGWRSFGLLFYA